MIFWFHFLSHIAWMARTYSEVWIKVKPEAYRTCECRRMCSSSSPSWVPPPRHAGPGRASLRTQPSAWTAAQSENNILTGYLDNEYVSLSGLCINFYVFTLFSRFVCSRWNSGRYLNIDYQNELELKMLRCSFTITITIIYYLLWYDKVHDKN